MADTKIPPYRRRRPPSPKTHARAAGDPLVVAHYNEAAATDGAGTEDDAAQLQALQKVLGPLNLPTLSAAQQQRVGELCHLHELASEGVPLVEKALRFSMAIKQPAAQHARTARGRKAFVELSQAARDFAKALDALDARSLINVLGTPPFDNSVGADLSGIERWKMARSIRVLTESMVHAAAAVAATAQGKAGAPSTPEHLLVAIEDLAVLWERYGPTRIDALKDGKKVPPRAAQNRKEGQFHLWAQALVTEVACLAPEKKVNTAIGQVVADRRSRAERADAELADSSAERRPRFADVSSES